MMSEINAELYAFDNIPGELKARSQWVVWRYEDHGKPKLAKVLYNPGTRHKGKSNDRTTWSSFAHAVAVFQRGGFHGIGFVFSADDPYLGVDLDGCRDPATGVIAGWALDVMRRFPGWYWEISPSGTGVHGIGRGRLPASGRRKGKIEVYASLHFFTVTGNHIAGTALVLEDHTAELEIWYAEVFGKQKEQQPNGKANGHTALADEEILTIARGATNGDLFTRLWAGAWTGYTSQSEADQALCNILAFYCGPNPAAIDRLFRQSGLHRPKWDQRHFSNGRTYGQATIERALADRTEFYRKRKTHARFRENGTRNTPPPPETESSDEEENARMTEQEREVEDTPDCLWPGLFGKAARVLGEYSWWVWVATYLALGARAHKNLHLRYYRPLHGMVNVLLLSKTSTGKSLPLDAAEYLLPGYPSVATGVQSAEGLLEILCETEPPQKKGDRPTYRSVNALLLLPEFSALVKAAKIENSRLPEALNAIFQSEKPYTIARSTRLATGGKIIVPDPRLSIFATTTVESYAALLARYPDLISNGFFNRYLTLPGRTKRWKFIELEHAAAPMEELAHLFNGLVYHEWKDTRSIWHLFAPDALARMQEWEAEFEKLMNDDPALLRDCLGRLHFYSVHIAALSAWSEKRTTIICSDVDMALAVCKKARAFMEQVLSQTPDPEIPALKQFEIGLEGKILDKIRSQPGMTERDLNRCLARQGSSADIHRSLASLQKAGVISTQKKGRTEGFTATESRAK
jgi:putative DNA primase/helicase